MLNNPTAMEVIEACERRRDAGITADVMKTLMTRTLCRWGSIMTSIILLGSVTTAVTPLIPNQPSCCISSVRSLVQGRLLIAALDRSWICLAWACHFSSQCRRLISQSIRVWERGKAGTVIAACTCSYEMTLQWSYITQFEVLCHSRFISKHTRSCWLPMQF